MPNPSAQNLLQRPPFERNGLFRWLHHSYLVRLGQTKDTIREEELVPFREFDELLVGSCEGEHELGEVFRIHARTFGMLGLRNLADRCWSQAARETRGEYLAGYSTSFFCEETVAWLLAHLSEADLSVAMVCEIGVSAAVYGSLPIVEAMLNHSDALTERLTRCEPFGDSGERWAEETALLSNRVIDLFLEAALNTRRTNVGVIRRILESGADPNLRIWCLERSCNYWHCPLSMAVERFNSEFRPLPLDVFDLLLAAGASPNGTEYDTLGHPLFWALHLRHDFVADRLLEAGASFNVPAPTGPIRKPGFEPGTVLSLACRSRFPKEAWIVERLGNIIPLVPDESKVRFHDVGAGGGEWLTYLDALVSPDDSVERLIAYQAKGFAIELSAEEVSMLVRRRLARTVAHILSSYGDEAARGAMAIIREHCPKFPQQ